MIFNLSVKFELLPDTWARYEKYSILIRKILNFFAYSISKSRSPDSLTLKKYILACMFMLQTENCWVKPIDMSSVISLNISYYKYSTEDHNGEQILIISVSFVS